MRQDRQHGFARRALYPPDSEATQANTDIMRVAGQTPAPATDRRMCELKAQEHDESEDTFETRLAIVKKAKVGGFILEINGDSAVVPCPCGCCAQCVTPRSSGVVS